MTWVTAAGGGPNPLHEDINSHGMRCAVTAAAPVDAAGLRAFAAALMTAIAAACVGAGAKDVSHVKAVLEHETGFLHADIVGGASTARVEGRDGRPVGSFSLVVNSVIFGLSAAAVREVTEAAIDDTIAKFGYRRAPLAE